MAKRPSLDDDPRLAEVSPWNRALLDLILSVKPPEASPLDCALNIIQNKARAERVMIDGLREISKMDVGQPAKTAQQILDRAYPETLAQARKAVEHEKRAKGA